MHRSASRYIRAIRTEAAKAKSKEPLADDGEHRKLGNRSLEAALCAFHSAESFREAVLHAVNIGDDADTTGAVCGQLAGACWGAEGIPKEWLDGLANAKSSKGRSGLRHASCR